MSRAAFCPPSRLTPTEQAEALARGRERLQRHYENLGRPVPPRRDPELRTVQLTRRLLADAAKVIDRDRDLCVWISDKVAQSKAKPGRPSDLCVRTALILLWVLAVMHESFNPFELVHMLGDIDWRDRLELAIDVIRDGAPDQTSYEQVLGFLHDLAATFDAWDDTLEETEEDYAVRAQRAQDLQDLADRLVRCSTAVAPTWTGDAAVDLTYKWGWEQPPGSLNAKKPTTGKNGGGDKPVSISDIVEEAGSADAAGIVVEDAATTTKKAAAGRTKRSKRWPSTWGLGSMWVGRNNITKSVHGVGVLTVTRNHEHEPKLVEAFSVVPANAHARAAALPILERLHEHRTHETAVAQLVARGRARYLGKISADPAFSDAAAWPLGLREMDASPVIRLHRTNQQPPKRIEIAPGVFVVSFNGRVYCECGKHTGLFEQRFPNWPFTKKELADYWGEQAKLKPFEWPTNPPVLDNGTRQLLRPHKVGPDGRPGGCEHCTHADGTAVVGDDGRPVSRCCTKASRRFRREDLPFWQDDVFGDERWYADWNRRNIVEGTYGIMKNVTVLNWGNDYHHHVGLAHETIITAFAICAHNYYMMRSWRAKQKLIVDDTPPPTKGVVTATLPPPPEPTVEPPRKGPKGLAHLGQPRAGP